MGKGHKRHQPTGQSQAASEPSAGGTQWSAGSKVLLVAVLLFAVALVVAGRPARDQAAPATTSETVAAQGVAIAGTGLPRLVDLGADRCIPCKAMAPILVELREEYAGRMEVEFIDVWKNPSAGDPYRIYMIPTQIFFDPEGRELHRHQGFISKADILATWKRLGFDFSAPAAGTTAG